MTVERRGAVTCRHGPWAVTMTTADARVPTARGSSPDSMRKQFVLLDEVERELRQVNCSLISQCPVFLLRIRKVLGSTLLPDNCYAD
jgi:hypothetical protein